MILRNIAEIGDFDISKIVREVAFFAKIPSPTFHEGKRAQYILKRLKEIIRIWKRQS